jgi:hypothetical protein
MNLSLKQIGDISPIRSNSFPSTLKASRLVVTASDVLYLKLQVSETLFDSIAYVRSVLLFFIWSVDFPALASAGRIIKQLGEFEVNYC